VPPAAIVINEWIFHDILGTNGPEAQERAEHFLEALGNGTHQIVVLRESPWTNKAWQLWKHDNVRVQILSKLLYLGVLVDPLKCRYLNAEQIQAIPDDLAEQVPGDDVYLFRTALASGAGTIVTTDGRLIDAVSAANQHDIRLITRDDFYQELGL